MIADNEELNRLLFAGQMVDENGHLKIESFPMDELLEKEGKSASLDRTALLPNPTQNLVEKLLELENRDKNRSAWGLGKSLASSVRQIELQDGRQAFDVFEDRLVNNPPKVWDNAHAKLTRAKPEFSRSLLRGCRDKLIECFSENIQRHDAD